MAEGLAPGLLERRLLALLTVISVVVVAAPRGYADEPEPGDGGVMSASVESACPPGTPSSGFPDVVDNAHEAGIDCVVWYEVALGVLPGAYRPGVDVRRDQMATFLTRLLEGAGAELPDDPDPHFDDVADNAHADAVHQLAELGIVVGTGADRYEPDRPVRRDQMASFLVRTYEHLHDQELPANEGAFADTAGNVHEDSIDKVATAGIALGTGPGSYAPLERVRRDQMASFLARSLALAVDHGHLAVRSVPAPALSTGTRLHPRGAGALHAGMTLREAEHASGTTLRVSEFETFGRYCYYAQADALPGVYLMVISPDGRPVATPRDGIVARVSSHRYETPNLRTSAGVRPADRRAAVTAAYGADQVDRFRHEYQPEGVYLDVVAADGRHALRFEVGGDDRISVIHAGDVNAITWPEGCA